MGLFAKAAAKNASTKDSPKSKKKSTLWLTNQQGSEQVGTAVSELIRLNNEVKARNAQMNPHKAVVLRFAEQNFIGEVVSTGVLPETPMLVQNAVGDKVTYVVQDRSSQYPLKDEQYEALQEVLGKEGAEKIVYEETSFAFNRDVLALPGVMAVMEKHLSAAVEELRSGRKPLLTAELADNLLDAQQKRSLRPGVVERLGMICGKSTTMLSQFLDALGSCVVRYVKV